jgi:prolyl-tRNA synthetase
MRWSKAHIPTLRDDPAEAEAISHKLLVRGGFMRQLSAGHYSMLPMGVKVRANIDRVIREEMDAIGGQQFHLPALHPSRNLEEVRSLGRNGRGDVPSRRPKGGGQRTRHDP